MLVGCFLVDLGLIAMVWTVNIDRSKKKTTDADDFLTDSTNSTRPRILFNPSSEVSYGMEQEIVFPDGDATTPNIHSRVDVVDPKCSSSLPFCETVDSYPYDLIKRVLQVKPLNRAFFGEDDSPFDIANRLGDEDETFICASTKQLVYPQVGENKNNKWRYIINQGGNDSYVQGVQVEMCLQPNKPCVVPGDSILDASYTMTCKQKYMFRRLYTLTSKGQVELESFKMPSACCCAYSRNLDFLSRIGKVASNKSMTNSTG